jgi:hypothetical protein
MTESRIAELKRVRAAKEAKIVEIRQQKEEAINDAA